jgi:hypothetical protein
MENKNQILLYQTDDGEARLEVLYEGETVWLTQTDMVKLFQTAKSTVSYHVSRIISSGELDREATVRKYRTVQTEGKRQVSREVDYYNLDMIISVGYRVNSYRGTQFRIWATKQLREFVIKGFVMDDDRMAHGGSNYFDELIERVRRIRTSEVNFYRKVRAIFATSIDYDTSAGEAMNFFATVQNKFHYAIHGHTAAELIVERVGSGKRNLGLTSWRGNVVTLKDATIAKNYLEELEIKRLELLVEQFLSFAELQSLEKKPMYMTDWMSKLDAFIILNEKHVLENTGEVSRKDMAAKVRQEYEDYKERKISEDALSEDAWNRMLDDAAKNMLPPPDDD